MRQGRKCLYRSCGHSQNNRPRGCILHRFPKDPIRARRWLHLSGVYDMTPKKLLTSWCICSCHFAEQSKVTDPVEFIEEYDGEDLPPPPNAESVSPLNGSLLASPVKDELCSPPSKTRFIDYSITPSTKAAVDALLCLPTSVHPATATDASPRTKPCKSPKYSPSRQLWSMRSNEVRKRRRNDMMRMLDFSDLGVSELPDEVQSIPDNDTTNNMESNYTADFSGQILMTSQEYVTSTPLLSSKDQPESGTCESCASGKEKASRSIGVQCSRSFLCYEKCKKMSEEDFQFYTGITQEIFEILYNFLGGDEVCSKLKYEYNRNTPKRTNFQGDLTPRDKLFMTLLRIRRGIPLRDLKCLFSISEAHASRICFAWIKFMSLEFRKLEQAMFVSTEAQNGRRPQCFKDFPNLRVIIDTSEFRIQRPHNLEQQSNCFSDYKNYHTIKFLIGISCFGGLSFLSEGYEGSISDRKIIEESGFLDHLESGDGVMSDKGFDIEDKCDEKEVDLYIPSFLGRRNAFTGRELIYSRAISVTRIFVEIFIGKIKDFRLVRYVIPNTMLPVANDLVRVCAFLVNFQKPFVSTSDGDGEE